MLARSAVLLTPAGPRELAALRGDEELCGWGLRGLEAAPLSTFVLRRATRPLVAAEADGTGLLVSADHPVLAAPVPTGDWWDVLLVERVGRGAALGLVRNLFATTAASAAAYRVRAEGEPACERCFVVERHAERRAALYALSLLATRYGLPVAELSRSCSGVDPRDLDRLFAATATEPGARRLKDDVDLDDARPHYQLRLVDGLTRSRGIAADLLLDGAPDGHVLTIHPLAEATSDRRGLLALAAAETVTFPTLEAARAHLQAHLAGTHVDVTLRALLQGRVYDVVPAAHLRPGMQLPVLRGGDLRATPVSAVSRRSWEGNLHEVRAGALVTLLVGAAVLGVDALSLRAGR